MKVYWIELQREDVLMRVPHKSEREHTPLLWGELESMVEKAQCIVILYHVVRRILGLRLRLLRVKVERDW